MIVYLIRHGETEHNARQEAHQTAHTPLSAKGIEQAHKLAEKFQSLKIEHITTSPLARAKKTAEQIANATGAPVTTDDLLRERKQPSEIEGKSYTDPEVQHIKKVLAAHKDDPTFHYSDEEHFEDIKKRALTCLRTLERRKEKHIAVVTHRHFIRMLLGVMAMGEDYPYAVYSAFDSFMYSDNASVSICRLQANKWRLLSFNDTSHMNV